MRKLEIIGKAAGEKLDAHAQVLHNLIAAQRRGAAEQFGYAFLAGRALLQAKAIVPNGNARISGAGFNNWVAANLPEITLRTAENWMLFAESILARAQVDAANSPLLLGSVEIHGSAHDSILRLVSEIMDGKGMMRFMRDSRLLRAPKRTRTSPTPTGSAARGDQKASTRASRVWEGILANLDRGKRNLTAVEKLEDLERYLTIAVKAVSEIQSAINARKCGVASGKRDDQSSARQFVGEPPRQNHEDAKCQSRKNIRGEAAADTGHEQQQKSEPKTRQKAA